MIDFKAMFQEHVDMLMEDAGVSEDEACRMATAYVQQAAAEHVDYCRQQAHEGTR